MTANRKTVNRKSLLIAAAIVVAAAGLIIAFFRGNHGDGRTAGATTEVAALDVTIDKESFTLIDGVAEKPAAPGSSAMNTVRVVGEEVPGDVTGDFRPEVAMLLSNDPGGSGTFYYAVLAVQNADGSWRATNPLPLGDRITPEGIEFTGGKFVYTFLDHAPGQSMADAPTVTKQVVIRFDPTSERISAGQ